LKELRYNDDMKDSLSPVEINSLLTYAQLYSFVELVSNGPRPDGTYNYCREALQKRATQLLKELKQSRDEAVENMG